MSKAATKGELLPPTPMGVSRHVLFVLYLLAIALTGLPPAAADPLIQMMEMNGAVAHAIDPAKRLQAIASIVGFGMTCVVLVGVGVGPVLNVIGTKVGALLGIALHVAGYFAMYMTDREALQWLAGLLFGISFQLIMSAHLSVGVLFPRNSSFILAGLSAGPDIALFSPPLMLRFAEKTGNVRSVIFTQVLIFAGIAAAIDLFFLPMWPFEPVAAADGEDAAKTRALEAGEKEALFSDEEAAAGEESAAAAAKADNPLWKLSAVQQMMTSKFLLFLPFFLISYARKKHYTTFLRNTLRELDPEPGAPTALKQINLYNNVVPYGFIPAMLWGVAVDKFGIRSVLMLSAGVGLFWNGLMLFAIPGLQYASVFAYISWQCFMFGMALAFLANAFGFATLPTLQGTAACITGLFSLLMDLYWTEFILDHLGSFTHATYILFGAGVAASFLPVALMFA